MVERKSVFYSKSEGEPLSVLDSTRRDISSIRNLWFFTSNSQTSLCRLTSGSGFPQSDSSISFCWDSLSRLVSIAVP
jgi:hypothetical protein